jgi:hypothetical protein
VLPSVPGCVIAGCIAFGFSVNALVVSAFVPVTGGIVSPGPWIVEVTPAADPSSTTA